MLLNWDIRIALRLKNGKTLHSQQFTAGMLWTLSGMQNLIHNGQAHKFLQTVPGTAVYWQKMLFETPAMLKVFGTPTFFMTFSAADYDWPEIIWAIGLEKGRHFNDEYVLCMTWEEKSQWLHSMPVMAVRQFQSHFNALHQFLQSKAGPLGIITGSLRKQNFRHMVLYTIM